MQLVICPICSESFKQISIRHLRSHDISDFNTFRSLYPNTPYISDNTRYGAGNNGLNNGEDRSKSQIKANQKRRELLKTIYKRNAKLCLVCSEPIIYEKRKNTFCGTSCSATHSNANKTHGCRRSKLEIYIFEQLLKQFPAYNFEANNRTFGFELDIYCSDLHFAIEINGITHFRPIYGEEKFKRIQKIDALKVQYCFNQNIDLFVVDCSSQKCFDINSSAIYLNTILEEVVKRVDDLQLPDPQSSVLPLHYDHHKL